MTAYHCIAADPPWREVGGGKSKRGADRHYPLLTVPEIIRVMLTDPAWTPHDDSHLWLWVTDKFLAPALTTVIPALGFRFVRHFTWVKQAENGALQMGLGQYGRGADELCLLAVRGKSLPLVQNRNVRSVHRAPRTTHSSKPASFYEEIIERVSPGPRLEMFARDRRAGWDAMGNEVGE